MRQTNLYRMLLPALALVLTAATLEARGLTGKSQIELRLGIREPGPLHTESWCGSTVTRTTTDRLGISLGYTGFVTRRHAFGIWASLVGTTSDDCDDCCCCYDDQYNAGVASIYIGMRHYLNGFDRPGAVRPYLSFGVGPVIGSEYGPVPGAESVYRRHTLTAMGAQVGGGADIIVGRHFSLGLHAAYNAMTDFSEPLAGRVNYSGGEFGVGFGVMF